MLTVAAAIRIPSLDRPLVEAHSFRQTQTALTAVEFADHGIDLLRPDFPAVGPPFELAMEFPLYQAVASVPISLGVDADIALRVTALAFFLLTAVLLFGLLRYVSTQVVAFAGLFAFLFSPFSMLWSRASMIEYLATAAAVGWVWAGIVWRDSGRRYLLIVAVVAGVVAMTVKVTTGVFWVFPLLLYRSTDELPTSGWESWLRARWRIQFAVLVGVPLLAGALWTKWADHVKQANPATRWATSSALTGFNFGALSDRLEWRRWSSILESTQDVLIGAKYVWLALIIVALWGARRDMFWIGLALTVFVTPLVFFNLYYLHDYYLAAISPGLAALLGLAAQQLWMWLPRIPRPVFVVSLACLWLVFTFVPSRNYVRLIYRSTDNDPYITAAREVRRVTSPDDLVIVHAPTINPALLYYAHRRGIIVFPDIRNSDVLEPLPDQPYRYFHAFDHDKLGLLRKWRWVGVVGPHTYALGPTSEASIVRATTRRIGDTERGTSTLLVCDGSTLPVPAGTEAVVIGNPMKELRIRFGHGLGPLPWVRTLRFAEPAELSCTGSPTLALRTRAY